MYCFVLPLKSLKSLSTCDGTNPINSPTQSLSYNGTVASSNITSGEILEVLSVEKSAVSDRYSQGSENVYMISIVNTGSVCYNELTVTDDLGAYSFGDDESKAVPLTYQEGSAPQSISYRCQQ